MEAILQTALSYKNHPNFYERVDRLLADKLRWLAMGQPNRSDFESAQEFLAADATWEQARQDVNLLRRFVAAGYELWDD